MGSRVFLHGIMDEKIIERLRDPDCYPGEPDSVEIIQTHLSVVCLAGPDVYKLKKPVVLPFVDYSTPEKREHFCHEELRLNRRLCPDLYREVVPLFAGPEGVSFVDEGKGAAVVDHAVLMHRLPEERMLNVLLSCGEVGEEAIAEVARIVAGFHREADRGPEVVEAGDPEHLRDYALANFSETRAMRGTIFDEDLHGNLEEATERGFEALLPVLKARVAEGRVVEGHGDLHARNICLSKPVAIYDCIEFSAGFRCGDTATENAFLAMDLIYRGHPELAERYLEEYMAASGDEGQRALMPALIAYRAMVRAKVSAIAAGETELSETDRQEAAASARRHLNLAAASAIAGRGPLLVVACGLPGTGKSTLFRELARATRWPIFSSDEVRKELAGVPATEKLPEECYREEFSKKTYEELYRRAEAGLSGGLSQVVLLDANFRKGSRRAEARERARRSGGRMVILWCEAGEETVRERMEVRSEGGRGEVSDADWEVYEKLKREFEAPEKGEADAVLRVDGEGEVEKVVSRALGFLVGGVGGGWGADGV